ncbi:hypothetical protein DV701_07620 [Ornithinimicrobium avium]|uniref:Uncharacterized protein n=1 Tax=Ornithinimicrobium avium TaxID=2283195 RepID=A0A345NLV4_9MICO|nr:hypothetical protein DV701_07620 [Ornithinimicrobium avium]
MGRGHPVLPRPDHRGRGHRRRADVRYAARQHRRDHRPGHRLHRRDRLPDPAGDPRRDVGLGVRLR